MHGKENGGRNSGNDGGEDRQTQPRMQDAGGVGMAGSTRGFASSSLESSPCHAYKLLGFFSLELTLRTDKQVLLHGGEICLRESLKQITFQHIIGHMRSDVHVHNNLLALTNELSLSGLFGYVSS